MKFQTTFEYFYEFMLDNMRPTYLDYVIKIYGGFPCLLNKIIEPGGSHEYVSYQFRDAIQHILAS